MKVNDNIYPSVDTSVNRDYTKKINEYPLNRQLDETIVYSSSSSKYANKSAKVIVNRRNTTGAVIDPILLDLFKNEYAQNLLVSPDVVYRSDISGNDLFYKGRFGYDVETYPIIGTNNLYSTKLLRGFKYYAEVCCIYVTYQTANNPITTASTDLQTYFLNHSDKKIINVYAKLYSGSESLRNSTALLPAHYDERSTILLENSAGDEFTQDSVLYYLPESFYRTVSSVESGYLLIGLNVPRLFYYTNQIAGKRAGSTFFNSDYVNWNNVTNISNDGYPCFFPEFTLTKEEILHMCACLGLLFTESETVARTLDLSKNENIGSNDLYFPVQDNAGFWQGNYTHGADNYNTKQYLENWNSDINAPFTNGSPSTSVEKYGDDRLTNHGGSTSALTHRYIVDNATMQTISNYINNVDDNLFTAIVNNMKMAGESPINSIVSVMYCPINISTFAPTTENIIIGTNFINVGTSENPVAVKGNKLVTDSIIFNLGECTINGKNKNYLDYEPYTKYVCYIPFCNFVELESSIVTNKKLGFQLVCDLVAGSCEGVIRIGGLNGRIYKSVGGTFATQCSVQGLDSANYVNGIVSSLGKYVGGIGTMIGATIGVATGGVSTAIAGAGLLAGAGTTASAIYDFSTNSKNFTATGKSIGLIGQRMPQHICIYKFECEDNADENYGEFVGYACEFSETLNNLHGFTVCANAKVTANATNTEKEKIKMLLETGVYI